MKVILLMDVKGTGKKDQIVEASDGFARNYLIPRKMAKEATPEALNAISRAKSADKHREDVRRAEAEQRARELKGKVIQLTVRGRRERQAVRRGHKRPDRRGAQGAARRRGRQAQA